MKQKMWCLVNKNKGKIIKVWVDGIYAVGFDNKKSLLQCIRFIEHDEEIREIKFKH